MAYAENLTHLSATSRPRSPFIEPSAPHLSAKAFMLIDANSGKIIAQKNATKRIPPASLTKMMTLYVVSNAIKNGQLSLKDKVRISKKAWKTPGSRMFVKEGQHVLVADLLKGIIVDSGNDACVALAEHVAGNEKTFASLMNGQAKALGMKNSHFVDSTGLPSPKHYSTAQDLTILSRALIKDFPEYYHWYKQKWFTFNGIRQPNRNRLLWRNHYVDGLKTGHTKEAGYCLVASAKKDGMRLISVVLGANTDSQRAEGSQRLLTFGYRFYETHELYKPLKKITQIRVWKGAVKTIDAGVQVPMYVTIPTGQYKRLQISMELPNVIEAPVQKGKGLGAVYVKLGDKVIAKDELVALEASPKGGLITRLSDTIGMSMHHWFGAKS